MYRVHEIIDFTDLECALAAAKIMKLDNSRHTILVDDSESRFFYLAEKDESGHVDLVKCDPVRGMF